MNTVSLTALSESFTLVLLQLITTSSLVPVVNHRHLKPSTINTYLPKQDVFYLEPFSQSVPIKSS